MSDSLPIKIDDLRRERSFWQVVSVGLEMKLLALWLVIGSPIVVFAAWASEMNVAISIGMVLAAALLIDCAGRACCLASPRMSRVTLAASVAIQCGALISAVAFLAGLYDYPVIGTTIGVTILVTCQAVVAVFFTDFLRRLAHALGREDLVELSRKVCWGIGGNVLLFWTVLSFTVILAIMTAALTLLFVWFGMFLGLGIGILLLAPFILIWVCVAIMMCGRYGKLLSELRQAIRNGPMSFPLPPGKVAP